MLRERVRVQNKSICRHRLSVAPHRQSSVAPHRRSSQALHCGSSQQICFHSSFIRLVFTKPSLIAAGLHKALHCGSSQQNCSRPSLVAVPHPIKSKVSYFLCLNIEPLTLKLQISYFKYNFLLVACLCTTLPYTKMCSRVLFASKSDSLYIPFIESPHRFPSGSLSFSTYSYICFFLFIYIEMQNYRCICMWM